LILTSISLARFSHPAWHFRAKYKERRSRCFVGILPFNKQLGLSHLLV